MGKRQLVEFFCVAAKGLFPLHGNLKPAAETDSPHCERIYIIYRVTKDYDWNNTYQGIRQ
jgi:hypothetical protein